MSIHMMDSVREHERGGDSFSDVLRFSAVHPAWRLLGGGMVLFGMSLTSTAYWVGFSGPDSVMLLSGLLFAVLGLLVSGYVQETVINVRDRRIQRVQGFYFIQLSDRVSFSDVSEVRVSHGKDYKVILRGKHSFLVEQTEDEAVAREWAAHLAQLVGAPLRHSPAGSRKQ